MSRRNSSSRNNAGAGDSPVVHKKNEGKIFEGDWKDSIPEEDVWDLKLQDSANGFNIDKSSSFLRFSAKSPFDFELYKIPYFYCLELKSTKGTSFSFRGKQPMIKPHQVKELLRAAKYDGIYAGIIFNFRSNGNHTYFVQIHVFKHFVDNVDKKSINEKDILSFPGGVVRIENELLVSHHRYDVRKFMEDCQKMVY